MPNGFEMLLDSLALTNTSCHLVLLILSILCHVQISDRQDKTMEKTDAGTNASISVSLLHTKLITKLNFNITF